MNQNQLILAYMRSNPITPLEALNKFGCLRLAARIKDLRDEGHIITTLSAKKGGKKFARYVLVKENK